MKKKALVLMMVLGIVSMHTAALADTSRFTIVVGGNNPDTISKRTEKNPHDDDNYFYVTGETISSPEPVLAKSYHLENPNTYFTKYGTTIKLYTDKAVYNVRVPHGEMYYMNTEFVNGIGIKTEITGRYTP